MNDTRNSKKEKNQHIQVFVRVRPINIIEKTGKSYSVLELPSNKEIVIHERTQGSHSKKFTFDKVFGPSSKQIDVYKAVVNPLLEEVLAGYNCTVFAYGQTGTGKTFTMEGASNDPTMHWQSDTTAGIIPRALSHLFDELRVLEVQEYTVRVSFLELYNEELFDLLSPNDDASKIRLFEDATRKGSVIIHGLEEVTVHNKNEVYKILEKGSEKRQTAATLMNAHSSRSHTVFSITVHIKENNVDGEELLKTGKLNLVDLAGSENIGRSGAVDRRAREAGNINQSLLTLGRVITALVERAPHIPYRESKLTRLLQESLGGRTKTSIIATVSPANINLEETLSTLDYAHRAKNITNRPEINQKLSKKALLKEYTEEIERLRRDLAASRERNGVYLAHENYNEMQSLIVNQNKEIEEKIAHIKVLQDTMEIKEQIFNNLQTQHIEQTNHLYKTKEQLDSTTHALQSTTARLELTEREKEEQCHLVEKHVSTEKRLFSQAQTLLHVADTTTNDIDRLHNKISHKNQLEKENQHLSHQFRYNIAKQYQDLENNVSSQMQKVIEFCTSMKDNIETQTNLFKRDINSMIFHMSDNIVDKEKSDINELTEKIDNSYKHYQQLLDTEMGRLSDTAQHECEFLDSTSLKVTSKVNDTIQINNLIITKNLRHFNDDVSQKIDKLLAFINESMKQMCDYKMEEFEKLNKTIESIRHMTLSVASSNEKVMEEQEKFKRSFDNLYVQFNKSHTNFSENLSNNNYNLYSINNMCESTTNDIFNNYNKEMERNNVLKEKVQQDINVLKSDVAFNMEENWTLAERVAEESCSLIDELQTDLTNRREILMQNKTDVEDNMKQIKQKFTKDNSLFVESIEDIHNTLVQGSNHQKYLMEQLKQKDQQVSTERSNNIRRHIEELSDWNDKTITQLNSIQERVGKFLLEDLRQDVPTGLTPAKKEYHYPRHLIETSPHERIIQRFREAKNISNNSEDDEILINNNTPKKQHSNAN